MIITEEILDHITSEILKHQKIHRPKTWSMKEDTEFIKTTKEGLRKGLELNYDLIFPGAK